MALAVVSCPGDIPIISMLIHVNICKRHIHNIRVKTYTFLESSLPLVLAKEKRKKKKEMFCVERQFFKKKIIPFLRAICVVDVILGCNV